MTVVDLTRPMVSGMPVWPGDPEVTFAPAFTNWKDGFGVTKLAFGSHAGTHMDAPAHVLAGGRTLDELPPETFVGSAAVVDGFPGLDDLEQYRGVDYLLFSTGWETKWGEPEYFTGYPVPPTVILERLIHMDVKGVGIDTPSPDGVEASALPHHRLLLGAGVVVLENLRGLEPLRGRRFPFCALPLLYEGADGGPVRAMAFLDKGYDMLEGLD